MKKMNNRKGFTLAELLIVVAIIAVLVAIAIPVFTSQLEKAREATDIANIRSAYAEVVVHYLDKADNISIKVPVRQRVKGVQTSPAPVLVYQGGGSQAQYGLTDAMKSKTSGSYTVKMNINSSTGVGTPVVQ